MQWTLTKPDITGLTAIPDAEPLEETVRRDRQGIPYLAPEVQLLYKSRRARPHDEADFARVAPTLDLAAREWLRDALAISEPGHRWLSALDTRLSA